MVSDTKSSSGPKQTQLIISLEEPWYNVTDKLLLKEAEKGFYISSISGSGDNSSKSLDTDSLIKFSSGQLSLLRDRGKEILSAQRSLYLSKYQNLPKSDYDWYNTVLSSGTIKDKISAYSLLIASAPIYYFTELRQLMSWLDSIQRKETVLEICEAITDLFLNQNCLPDDRKLFLLEQRQFPLSLAESYMRQLLSNDTLLMCWYVEDCMKRAYMDFLVFCRTLSNDPVFFIKNSALKLLVNALSSKPEQERSLLKSVITKLGDPERKIASNVVYFLVSILLKQHPNMAPVIIQQVWDDVIGTSIALSSNSLRAKYFGIVLLSQIPLNMKTPAVANLLVRLYLQLFAHLIQYQNDSIKDEKGQKSKTKARKTTHPVKKTAKVHLDANELQQIEKMNAILLKAIHRALPFVSESSATGSFSSESPGSYFLKDELDILYQLVHSKKGQWNMSLQALWLLYRLMNISPKQTTWKRRFYRALYESLLDTRLDIASLSKQHHFLQLIYQAIIEDDSDARVASFLKRLLQVCTFHQVPFIAASLVICLDVLKKKPSLKSLLNKKDSLSNESAHTKDDSSSKNEASSIWLSCLDYDPKKRDPEYAEAERTIFYEILPYLLSHYHPSVTKLASLILSCVTSRKNESTKNTFIWNDFNTFSSLSGHAFLERFVYKNPKKISNLVDKESKLSTETNNTMGSSSRGNSIETPTHLKYAELPVSSRQYARLSESSIPEHEKFFHFFFKERLNLYNMVQEKKNKKQKKRKLKGETAQRDLESESFLSDGDEDDIILNDDDSDFKNISFGDIDNSSDIEKADVDDRNERKPLKTKRMRDDAENSDSDFETQISLDSDTEENFDWDALSTNSDGSAGLIEDLDDNGTFSQDLVREDEIVLTKGKKKKSLPLIAAAEDYAQYMTSDDEGHNERKGKHDNNNNNNRGSDKRRNIVFGSKKKMQEKKRK